MCAVSLKFLLVVILAKFNFTQEYFSFINLDGAPQITHPHSSMTQSGNKVSQVHAFKQGSLDHSYFRHVNRIQTDCI